MKYVIEDIAKGGFVPDRAEEAVPDGVWQDCMNVRFVDGAVEKIPGHDDAFGSLSATPLWATSISDGLNIFWVYAGENVLYATDGAAHANVTPATASVSGQVDITSWTGGALNGFVIANDGRNPPIQWSPSLGNDFTSLTAWPSTITAEVIRPHGAFLFALRINESGNTNPRLIRWSDAAPDGALPRSWDFTDPTNQAGITELGHTGDALVDCLSLRNNLVIYKEFNTWIAEPTSGPDIFGFRQLFAESGLLSRNCAFNVKGVQLALTDSDLIVHDGSDARSIADGRVRKWLFRRINTARFKRCFIAGDYLSREALICFPESGYDWPNLALVWNWAEDKFSVRELGGMRSFGIHGVVPNITGSLTMDEDVGTFDTASGPFDEQTYDPSKQKTVLFPATGPLRAHQLGVTEAFAGSPFQARIVRSSIAFSREPSDIVKEIKAILPKVYGTVGDTVNFYIATRMTAGEPVQYQGPFAFTIGVDYKIDVRIAGRLLDLRMEYTGNQPMKLSGLGVWFDEFGER